MEHIPGVKPRKLNLMLIFQGVHMSDDPLFSPAPIVQKKSKNYCLKKSRPGGGWVERVLFICF